MTSIAVDLNAGENGHIVLYIGTDSGRLMRIRPEMKMVKIQINLLANEPNHLLRIPKCM